MPWIRLSFETDAAFAEPLSAALDQAGAAAVTLEDSADQPLYEPPPGATPLWRQTRVIGLFPAEADVPSILAGLSAVIGALPPHRAEPLEDKDWNRAWMDAFQPMRFGRRLWIVPSWHTPPDPQGVNLLLDPGLAFGTGTHPTTRLCLEWLDAHELGGRLVLDYGCGSGVLAIAAALLGAAAVAGVDNDPQALLATRDNAARNGVSDRVTAYLPESAPTHPADVLVANILARPLIELAPVLAARVRAGGLMALSGILPEQAADVADAYRPWFTLEPPQELEGWVRIAGARRAD